MTIVIPGIIFWLILLIATWIITYVFRYNKATKDPSLLGIVGFLISTFGTFFYFVYAIIWIIDHWNKIPLHIILS